MRRARLVLLMAMAAALAVLIGVAVAPGQQAGNAPAASAAPAGPQPAPMPAAVREAQERREAQRATPEARRARAESRGRYRGQDADAAAETARRHHGGAMNQKVGRLVDGGFKRFLSDRAALVERDGRQLVAASTIPLRANGRVVDLTLNAAGDAYRSENPIVDATIPKRLTGGVRLPGSEFSFLPVAGAADVEPALVEGKVFWANALPDADVVVMPTTGGVETMVQLRSAESPEQLRMPFELPPGAVLREHGKDPVGFEIVRADERLGFVSRPTAADAEGFGVPLEVRVEGSELVIDVPHRSADLAYPIMVDPYVYGIWRYGSGFEPWRISQPANQTQMVNYAGDWFMGRGLYTYNSTSGGWYNHNDASLWYALAPGNSYVDQADFYYLTKDPEGSTCTMVAIWSSSTGYGPTQWDCAAMSLQSRYLSRAPSAGGPFGPVLQTHMSGSGQRWYTMTYLGGSIFYYGDLDAPSSVYSNAPSYWSSVTRYFQPYATDAGVGVKWIEISSPDGYFSGVTHRDTHGCSGDQSSYCPGSWYGGQRSTATLPEGEVYLDTVASDLIGRTRSATRTVVRTDRTPPQITQSGALYDLSGGFVTQATPLRVSATDGTLPLDASKTERLKARSGVASVELLVDGLSVDATMPGVQRISQSCPAGSCSWTGDLYLDPAPLSEGRHTVQVRATDQLGQSQLSTPFKVSVDRTAPVLNTGGALTAAANTTLAPGNYELTIEGLDGAEGSTTDAAHRAGVRSLEVKVDGRRHHFESASCSGNCARRYTWILNGDGFTPGAHTVEVVAEDSVGLRTSRSVNVNVPPKNSQIASGAGYEEYFDYRDVPTGAGTAASVNLGTGNVVWHFRPISTQGRGISTNVDVTYNSLSSLDDLGHGYHEIGDGFSLAIGTVTRVNEAMDVRAADSKGVITLTDADGTLHRFTKSPSGAWFDAPAGVNLRLRKYIDAPADDAQRQKVWAATRPDGITYFFDRCGYQRSVEDRTGNVMRYEYEPAPPSEGDCFPNTQALQPKLRRVIDAHGVSTPADAPSRSLTIEYDNENAVGYAPQITRITDLRGRVTTFEYSNPGRLIKLTQAYGTAEARSFQFAYEVSGRDKDLISLTDPLGRTTTLSYRDDQSRGGAPLYELGERLDFVTNRRGHTTRFDYAEEGTDKITTVTDNRGKVWKHRVDANLRPTSLTDPLGTVSETAWDTDNNPIEQRVAVGTADLATTAMTWNANGQLLTHTDAESNTTELTYRNHPGTHVAASGVDAGGGFVSDLLMVTAPKGYASATVNDYTTTYDVELNGNVRSRTDGEGWRTQWDYTDSFGLVKEERQETDRGVFARTTFSDFDPSGQPQTIVDARGNATADTTDGIWKLRYSRSGMLLDARDPRGTQTPGDAVREPYTTEYDYDALDRVKLERVPRLSSSAQFIERTIEYDLNDNVKRTIDGLQAATTRDYDAMDQLTLARTPAVPHDGEATPAAEETTFDYDEEGNLVKQVDPPGNLAGAIADSFTTRMTYDDAGQRVLLRRLSRTATESKDLVTSWAYDRRGNVTAETDPRRNAEGGDPLVNPTVAAKQRFEFRYDRANRRTFAIEDPAGKRLATRWGYDANGNPTDETDPRGKPLNGLDPATNPELEKYTTHRTFDQRDLLREAIDPKDRVTLYEHRGDELLVGLTSPRGTATTSIAGDFKTTYTYDGMGGLTSRSIPYASTQYGPKNWKVTYGLDAVGNARTITDARNNTITNTFFDTGELRTTTRPGWWIYDEDGDALRERTPRDPRPGAAAPSPSATDDAAGDFGRVEPQPEPPVLPMAGATTFGYDNEMRLTSVAGQLNHAVEIKRDLLGRVAERRFPFGPEAFDAANAPRAIVERLAYDRRGFVRASTQVQAHEAIAADGTRSLNDVVHRYDFDQFGRMTSETAPGSATSTETTTFGYDENGNLRRRTTPRGPFWELGYDPLDRRTSITDPKGKLTTFGFDDAGNENYVLPPRGQGRTDSERYATFRTFNPANELEKLEAGRNLADGVPRVSNFLYDEDGNEKQRTVPGARSVSGGAITARVTRSTYDGRGLLWARTTGTGTLERTTVTEYDANGNLRRQVNPAGVDRGTELPRVSDPGGTPASTSTWTEHATVFAYDADDLMTTRYMPWGRKTVGRDGDRWRQDIVRDARGRVKSVRAPYLMTASPGKSNDYTYYDNEWIKTAWESSVPENTLVYDYDRRGNQKLWSSDGQYRQIKRTFFPNGLLKERNAVSKVPDKVRDSKYAYTYNANRSLETMADLERNRTTVYDYDPLEQQTHANETWTSSRDTRITYDDNGNVVTRQTDGRFDGTTYVGGKTSTFTYDEQDREKTMSVQNAGESLVRGTETRYYPSDEIAERERWRSSSSNRVLEARYFGDDGRIVRLTRQRKGVGSFHKNRAYTYDDANNTSTDVTAWGNGNRATDERGTHVFNSRDQLARWTSTSGTVTSYELNGAGAITKATVGPLSKSYFYSGDRLTHTIELTDQFTGATCRNDYSYNTFGNVTLETPGTGCSQTGKTEYDYDAFERLTSTKSPNESSPATFTYDALDRRDYKLKSGTRYDYAYVGSTEALSREESPTGAPTRFYDYDSSLTRIGQATKTGTNALSYNSYALDANGSVEGLENDSGDTTQGQYTYTPYGDSTASGTAAAGNPFRYQGHYLDQEGTKGGTYDMRARHYSPAISRFLSADRYESSSADLALQLNPTTNDRYAFLAGNPIDRFEIDGHDPHAQETHARGCFSCKVSPERERRAARVVARALQSQAAAVGAGSSSSGSSSGGSSASSASSSAAAQKLSAGGAKGPYGFWTPDFVGSRADQVNQGVAEGALPPMPANWGDLSLQQRQQFWQANSHYSDISCQGSGEMRACSLDPGEYGGTVPLGEAAKRLGTVASVLSAAGLGRIAVQAALRHRLKQTAARQIDESVQVPPRKQIGPAGNPGALATHDHHIFPQKFQKFFKSKGIEIDDFTVPLETRRHLRGVHGRGLHRLPGRWNKRWEDFISENPGASPTQVMQFGGRLMDEYGLSGLPIRPYKSGK